MTALTRNTPISHIVTFRRMINVFDSHNFYFIVAILILSY